MAAQMAQLLVNSDLDELKEIIRRWLAEAPSERIRKQYEVFGAKLLELKHALAEAPVAPTQDELELALNLMLKLAAESGRTPQ